MLVDEEKIVKQAIEYDALDIGDVQQSLELKKRTKILNDHKYAISRGPDQLWRSYVPDKTMPHNRRMLKRKNREALEDAIVAFYEQQQAKKVMTMESLYPEWLHYYSLHVDADGTVNYVTWEWSKFYENDPIVKIPLTELTTVQLDEWMHERVKTYQMTKTAYYNMSLIMRQMLAYAEDMGYVDEDPFAGVHVSPKLFRKKKKPASETQVFTLEEEMAIIDEAWKDFESDPTNTAPLSIVLSFYLGIRPGEVVAFKESDIEGKEIHVERMERKAYQKVSETKYKQSGRQVVDHAKTSAGTRYIYLVKDARKVIRTILKSNRKNGYEKGSYLFMEHGERIDNVAVSSRLKKYCRKLGIRYRSPNKIRKTYISKLIDSGMNIDQIRESVGHENERTTFNNYCFNRRTKDQTRQDMEDALAMPKSPKPDTEKVISFNQESNKTVINGVSNG